MANRQSNSGSVNDRFLALLHPLQRELEIYTHRLIWDPGQIHDAIQYAILRAYKAFDRYDEQASFRAWIFKILTREIFALNRKHARVAQHEFQLDPEEIARMPAEEQAREMNGEHKIESVSTEHLDDSLVLGLKTLTDNERAVLLLRAIADHSYREISHVLEMPVGSVMGHLARARQKMRAALGRLQRSKNSNKTR